jgi:hypothetical protein
VLLQLVKDGAAACCCSSLHYNMQRLRACPQLCVISKASALLGHRTLPALLLLLLFTTSAGVLSAG